MNDNEPPQYLTPEELSRRLRGAISVRTLANWRCVRQGPRFTKAGGKILYPLAEVILWEQARTVSGTDGYRATG